MILVLETKPPVSLPTWKDLVEVFGPTLGSIIFFITIIIILQWYWYRENIKSKNSEIERSVKRTTELETLNNELVNKLIKDK